MNHELYCSIINKTFFFISNEISDLTGLHETSYLLRLSIRYPRLRNLSPLEQNISLSLFSVFIKKFIKLHGKSFDDESLRIMNKICEISIFILFCIAFQESQTFYVNDLVIEFEDCGKI